MDGEPGFVEHGCESKPDKAKNTKTHWVHQHRGTIFFGYFLCSHKESTSLQRSEKHILASKKKGTRPGGPKHTTPAGGETHNYPATQWQKQIKYKNGWPHFPFIH